MKKIIDSIDQSDLLKLIFEEKVDLWNDYRESHPEWIPELGFINLDDKKLNGINLSNAILKYSSLKFTDLSRSNLAGAKLENVCFIDTKITNADIQNAVFYTDSNEYSKSDNQTSSLSHKYLEQELTLILDFDNSSDILITQPIQLVKSVIFDLETIFNCICYSEELPWNIEMNLKHIKGGSLKSSVLAKVAEVFAKNLPKNTEEGIWTIISAAFSVIDAFYKGEIEIPKEDNVLKRTMDNLRQNCKKSKIKQITIILPSEENKRLNLVV